MSAATKAEDDFQGCRSLKGDNIDTRVQLERQIVQWIGDAKSLVFRKLWGAKWVVAYSQVGFKRGTIETPSDTAGKLEVLRAVASWLARNPSKEVVTKNPVTGEEIRITSLHAGELEAALDAAINKVEDCVPDRDVKAKAREEAEEQLRGRIRLVAGELDMALDPTDPRWTAYGLPKPGETERPSQVTGVQVSLPAPKIVHLTWEQSERVVRYKVRALITGKDNEPRVVAEVYEEQADLLNFAPGDVVKLDIVATNSAGDSAPSEVVSITLPLAAVA